MQSRCLYHSSGRVCCTRVDTLALSHSRIMSLRACAGYLRPYSRIQPLRTILSTILLLTKRKSTLHFVCSKLMTQTIGNYMDRSSWLYPNGLPLPYTFITGMMVLAPWLICALSSVSPTRMTALRLSHAFNRRILIRNLTFRTPTCDANLTI